MEKCYKCGDWMEETVFDYEYGSQRGVYRSGLGCRCEDYTFEEALEDAEMTPKDLLIESAIKSGEICRVLEKKGIFLQDKEWDKLEEYLINFILEAEYI